MHPLGDVFNAAAVMSEFNWNYVKKHVSKYVLTAIFLGENPASTLLLFGVLPAAGIGGLIAWTVVVNKNVWLPSFAFTEGAKTKSRVRFRVLPALSAVITACTFTVHTGIFIAWNEQLNFEFKPLERVLLGSELLFLIQLGVFSVLCSVLYTIYPNSAPNRHLVYYTYVFAAMYFAVFYLLYGLVFVIRLKFVVKGHSFRESVEFFVKANPGHALAMKPGFRQGRIYRFTPKMKQALIEFAPSPVNYLYSLAKNKYFTAFVFGFLPATITMTPAAMDFGSLEDDDEAPEDNAPKIDFDAIALDTDDQQSDVNVPLLGSSRNSRRNSAISVLNAKGSEDSQGDHNSKSSIQD